MSDLVTFGETMLRLSPPDEERLETADQYDVHVAGAESNVAVAAERLGHDTVWLSKLPDSPVGRRVAGELRTHGVTVEVAWDDSPECRQGTYYFERGQSPRGGNVIYDRAGASVTTAEPPELSTDLLGDATCFHTTGITPALSETLAATTAELLAEAQAAETLTSLDLNYRSTLWEPERAAATLTALFPDVDILVVAKRDAHEVLDEDGDAEAIARSLDEQYGFEVVIVTRGAEGALAMADGTVYEQPTFEATNAYPVGTGDAFVGGFLANYLDTGAVSDALAWGAAAAALKRSIPGDIAVISPAEIREIVAGDTESLSR